MTILDNKYYDQDSVFKPENLLREARRQKGLQDCAVPVVCLLDPDGDLFSYLLRHGRATQNNCWVCYHSKLYTFQIDEIEIGIIPYVIGSAYAVLVAEQLFVSGCKSLLSITSAGIVNQPDTDKKYVLITSSVRDEGTSYHYLPADHPATLNSHTSELFIASSNEPECPYITGASWTTDAPYRETASAIRQMQEQQIYCVEMEAAALYALSEARQYNIVCFAHLTNSMAQTPGDFEKGVEFGSLDTLSLVKYAINILSSVKIVQL